MPLCPSGLGASPNDLPRGEREGSATKAVISHSKQAEV